MKASKIAIACLFLFILSFSGKVSGQTSVGLWAYYPFEANLNDASGNGHPLSGNYNQPYSTDKNGEPNKAILFQGGNGVSTTNYLPLTNSSFTIGFWYYVQDDASRGGFYEGNYSGSPYNRVILGKFASGVIHAQLIDINGTTITLTTPHDLNTWVRYDLTFEASTKTLTFYKNGAQINQTSNTNFSNNINESSGGGINVGWNPGNGVGMNGEIDELRLYTRALNGTEILEIYNSFIPLTVTANVNNAAFGSITPSGSVNVLLGSAQNFTASATTGYQFDYFIVDNNTSNQITTNPYTFTNVTSGHSITAYFSQIPQAVEITSSVNDASKGSINPSGVVTVNPGTNQQFTATASSQYQFDYFLINGTQRISTNPYTLTNVTAATTIQAFFKNAGSWSYKENGTEKDIYYMGGKVGVGTDNIPIGYNFAVNGKMITEEVVVKLNAAWPDYVFEPQYELKPLTEIENYIAVNKHLPDMPSASEVDEKGVQLGDIQAKLLRKIEELTLYLIELKKENSIIKNKINQLESIK